jgi:hypothetical protein
LISHTEPAAEAAWYGENAEEIKGSLHENGSPGPDYTPIYLGGFGISSASMAIVLGFPTGRTDWNPARRLAKT